MNANNKAKEIYSLLSDAWLLSYDAEKKSETEEEKEIFHKINTAINKVQCECHPLLERK